MQTVHNRTTPFNCYNLNNVLIPFIQMVRIGFHHRHTIQTHNTNITHTCHATTTEKHPSITVSR